MFGSATFVVVHVEELILETQFHIAPGATVADTVELGAARVVALLAAEEEVTAFNIPTLEVIRLVEDDLFRIHIGPVGHPSALDTETIDMASQFSGGDEVVVSVLDVVGVDIFLAADVGGVTAAETGTAVGAELVGGLGLVVHHGTADMHTIVGLVDGTDHNLADIGPLLRE